jgi:hypothetical protein
MYLLFCVLFCFYPCTAYLRIISACGGAVGLFSQRKQTGVIFENSCNRIKEYQARYAINRRKRSLSLNASVASGIKRGAESKTMRDVSTCVRH